MRKSDESMGCHDSVYPDPSNLMLRDISLNPPKAHYSHTRAFLLFPEVTTRTSCGTHVQCRHTTRTRYIYAHVPAHVHKKTRRHTIHTCTQITRTYTHTHTHTQCILSSKQVGRSHHRHTCTHTYCTCTHPHPHTHPHTHPHPHTHTHTHTHTQSTHTYCTCTHTHRGIQRDRSCDWPPGLQRRSCSCSRAHKSPPSCPRPLQMLCQQPPDSGSLLPAWATGSCARVCVCCVCVIVCVCDCVCVQVCVHVRMHVCVVRVLCVCACVYMCTCVCVCVKGEPARQLITNTTQNASMKFGYHVHTL